MEEMRNAHNILVKKPEWKKSPGRPRHRWRIILEWVLREIGCESVD
jgi:hypothetical protein